MPGRRSSWRSSTLRRGRSGAAANGGRGGGGNNAVGMSNRGIAVSQYKRKLNPYKSSTTSSRGGILGDSIARGVSDDDLDLGIDDGDLDLGGDDDDDDLGLDNILSSITGLHEDVGVTQARPPGGADAIPDSSDAHDVGVNDISTSNHTEPIANSSVGRDVADEKKEMLKLPPNGPRISEVNFGDDISHGGGSHSAQTSDLDEDTFNPASAEDHDTLWSEGDATKEHKMILQSGPGPAFSSGGFEDNTRMEPMPMTGPSFQTGAKSGRSLVDSIIDDISMTDSLPVSAREMPSEQMTNNYSSLTSSRDRFSDDGHGPSRFPQPDPSTHMPRDAPQSSLSSKKFGGRNAPPSKVTTKQKNTRGNPEDETLSTVTDPSETPVIYTYKKPMDDDSVSQITSSLAGNSSFGSSHLQNVPTSLSSRSRGNRSGMNGLSWMDNGTGGGGGGLGMGRSRMIHRKGGLPGPYGRDRGSSRSSPKSSSLSPPGGGNGGRSRSGSGSGSTVGSVPSFEGGQSNLDEIAYALNTDCAPKSGRGGNQRTRMRPTPPVRGGAPLVNGGREGAGGVSGNDDLSTVESSRVGGHEQYIDTNVKSNVSRLGMGGVSCGAQSVGETTAVSESSGSSTQGLLQSLAMFAWRAQHRAGRFFFPTSAAVARRKKFDRCDSVDDLDDILLEEGSSAPPHRKHPRAGVRHGNDEDEEEEIDYFSRAMSASSNNGHGTAPRNSKRGKKSLWNGGTVRVGGLFFALTYAFTAYRMPGREAPALAPSNQGRAGVGGRYYDTIPEKRHEDLNYRKERSRQALDYVGGANQVFEYQEGTHEVMVDDNPYPDMRAETAGAGRLGRPIDAVRDDRSQNFAAANPMADNDAGLGGQAGTAGGGRLGQPKEYNLVESDAGSLSSGQRNFPAGGAVQLPSNFEALANVDDLLFQKGIDIPFYWHVPRSGGGTMNDVLGSCLHLTLAADAGGGGREEETLRVLNFSHQVSYVNVDTSTHQGISHAKKLDLASSGLADVVISPLLHEASTLFTPTRRGRLFTIFRHPVERAASLFYFIQETQWKQPGTRNDQFADIAIEQFYKDGFAENNWMTRFLTNELTKGELTEKDLSMAKEVLRQKCLVGLLEEKGETFQRLQKYFGWRPKNEEEQDCFEKKLEWAWPMKHKHPAIEEGSAAWRLILAANKFDLRLYEHAKELFSQQKFLFPHR